MGAPDSSQLPLPREAAGGGATTSPAHDHTHNRVAPPTRPKPRPLVE